MVVEQEFLNRLIEKYQTEVEVLKQQSENRVVNQRLKLCQSVIKGLRQQECLKTV